MNFVSRRRLKVFMKISSLFIANNAEVARPLARFMDRKRREDEIFEDHALSDRLIFSVSDSTLLITPIALDREFVSDVKKILRIGQLTNLSPKQVKESVCEAIFEDKELLKKITWVIKKNPNIRILSYAGTPEFFELITYLRKKGLSFKTPELPKEGNQWVTDFIDSKSGFRQVVPLLGWDFPQMPKGVTCLLKEDTIGWATYLLENCNGCVLKTNRGLAGAGLQIIKKDNLKGKKPSLYVASIIESEPYWEKEPVVVEEYILPQINVCGGSPNIELKMTDRGIKPLYVCGMRITESGVFRGIELGKNAVPGFITQNLLRSGKKLGQFLWKLGYRGFFEIDFVYGISGKLYPVEANLRRTGGTHVYDLARRILGGDFSDNYYIAAVNLTNSPRFYKKSYSYVKETLKPYLFPKENSKEGVILIASTFLKIGKIGYVIIGKNREQVYELEGEFLTNLV